MTSLYNLPLYQQLAHRMEEKISNLEWLPGMKIPSERDMAAQYGVNRLTVSRAINLLVDKGIIVKKANSGTYVAKKINSDFARQTISFDEKSIGEGMSRVMQKNGATVHNKVLVAEIDSGKSFILEKLQLEPQDEFFHLKRIRLLGDVPFAIENSYLPIKYFSDVLDVDFRIIGLYDYIKSRGHSIGKFNKQINLIPSDNKTSTLLNIEDGKLLYAIQYKSFDLDSNVVEYTESLLVPELIKLNYFVQY